MEHIEARPTWDCRACGEPWPCPDAQTELKAQMSPTSVRIHMWLRLEVAAEDMPTATALDMFDRFLRWTP